MARTAGGGGGSVTHVTFLTFLTRDSAGGGGQGSCLARETDTTPFWSVGSRATLYFYTSTTFAACLTSRARALTWNTGVEYF